MVSAPATRSRTALPTSGTQRIVTGTDPGVLAQAAHGGAELAVWRRATRPEFDAWLDALARERLPRCHAEVVAGNAESLVLSACREVGLEAEGPAAVLAADMAELARRFCRLSGLTTVDLRVEPIDHDACRFFHRDRVALRMVATYRGPGTQIVPGERADEALRLQGEYDGPLEHLQRGSIALFQGSARGDTGVVHRSPPMAGLAGTRLLLCLSVPFR